MRVGDVRARTAAGQFGPSGFSVTSNAVCISDRGAEPPRSAVTRSTAVNGGKIP